MHLEKLRSFVADILDSQQPITPERLMRFVRDGGLHYESKLIRALGENSGDLETIADRDLKGLLLGALKDLEAGVGWGRAPRGAGTWRIKSLSSRGVIVFHCGAIGISSRFCRGLILTKKFPGKSIKQWPRFLPSFIG